MLMTEASTYDLFMFQSIEMSMFTTLQVRDGRAARARAKLEPILLSLTGSAQLGHF